MCECDEMDWISWELVEANQKALLEKQLQYEIGVAHQLYDALDRLAIVARDGASDDILVVDPASPFAYIVHLTWPSGTDAAFPHTYSISKALLPLSFR
ncbi:MAG: hypothetical protein AAGE03_07860, partial [Pseudomonadota bacterium]